MSKDKTCPKFFFTLPSLFAALRSKVGGLGLLTALLAIYKRSKQNMSRYLFFGGFGCIESFVGVYINFICSLFVDCTFLGFGFVYVLFRALNGIYPGCFRV